MKTADPITNSHLASTYHEAGTLQTPQGVYEGGNSTIIEIKVEGHALPKVTQRGQWQAGCECFPEPRYSSVNHRLTKEDSRTLGAKQGEGAWGFAAPLLPPPPTMSAGFTVLTCRHPGGAKPKGANPALPTVVHTAVS